MDRNDFVDRALLPRSVNKDIEEFCKENFTCGDTLASVLEAYLAWNGIRGYTAQILSIVEATNAR
jgi:hypothetical protein